MAILEADLCQLVQQDLADVAGNNYGLIQRTPTGLLSAAVSETNTAGRREAIIMDTGDGKGPKQALIEFMQPASTTDISTDVLSVCEDGEERPKLRFLKSITKYARTTNLKFTKADLRKFCEAPQAFRAKVVAGEMDALFRVVNRICVGQYIAGVGSFWNGVSGPKSVNMLDSGVGLLAADPSGEITMKQDFQDIGYQANPLVVGAGYLDTYTKYQKIGCCNQFGHSINEIGDFDYYWDRDVDTVVGSPNNFVAFTPGSIQFVSWNENKGDFAIRHAHFDETTVIDPYTNIELDMEVNYDRCDKVWIMQFSLHFDLFVLPLTMYKVGDDREGVNGTFQYLATKTT